MNCGTESEDLFDRVQGDSGGRIRIEDFGLSELDNLLQVWSFLLRREIQLPI